MVNLGMMVVGIGIFILSLFLAQALPPFLTTVNTASLDLLKIFFLFIGSASIFIGATSK